MAHPWRRTVHACGWAGPRACASHVSARCNPLYAAARTRFTARGQTLSNLRSLAARRGRAHRLGTGRCSAALPSGITAVDTANASESSSPSTSYPAPVEAEDFVTAAEAAHLIRLAAPLLQPSKLNAAGAVGASTNTATRRSLSAELPHAALTDDPVLRAVGLRVAEFSGTTVEQQEPLQVVRYDPGDYFGPHFDAGRDVSTSWLGQRKLTVLLYLDDDFEGGATSFPEIDVEIAPTAGKAILFHNLQPLAGGAGAVPHPLSLHAGMPVTRGVKHVVNVWIREKTYLPPTSLKYAAVAAYLALVVTTVVTVAVVFKPAWLMPS